MKEIQLVGGGCTCVSDEDFDEVSKRRWRIWESPNKQWQYAVSSGGGWATKMHRLLLKAPAGVLVDHIDGNGLNNLRENLRLVTHSQNQQNTTSSANQKRGGFKGVHWKAQGSVWCAMIRIPNPSGGRGRRKYLGSFKDPIEAARAYDRASLLYHSHGSLNFPP